MPTHRRHLFLTAGPAGAGAMRPQPSSAPCGTLPNRCQCWWMSLSRHPCDPDGLGQPEHARDGLALRELSCSGGQAHRPAAGAPPHTQARELAESHPELAYGMAEIEFRVLARACPPGRNPGEDALQKNITIHEAERNAAAASINWRFTTKDARARLRRLHPDTSALTQCWRRPGILRNFDIPIPCLILRSVTPAVSPETEMTNPGPLGPKRTAGARRREFRQVHPAPDLQHQGTKTRNRPVSRSWDNPPVPDFRNRRSTTVVYGYIRSGQAWAAPLWTSSARTSPILAFRRPPFIGERRCPGEAVLVAPRPEPSSVPAQPRRPGRGGCIVGLRTRGSGHRSAHRRTALPRRAPVVPAG